MGNFDFRAIHFKTEILFSFSHMVYTPLSLPCNNKLSKWRNVYIEQCRLQFSCDYSFIIEYNSPGSGLNRRCLTSVNTAGKGTLKFEVFAALAARFMDDDTDDAELAKELKEAFRLYDKEGLR